MAGTGDDGLGANLQPRKDLPKVPELFGDVEPFPVFRDIAAVCENSARNHAFAWPLRFPFPPVPPSPPDFAGLVSMYCNHLAHVLVPRAGHAAPDEDSYSTQVTGELTFLLLAAHSYATHLPATVAAPAYLDAVASALLSGMRVAQPDNEHFWLSVDRRARKTVDALVRDCNAGDDQLVNKLTDFFLKLPAVERRAQGDALRASYSDGQHLFGIICGGIASRR